MRKEEEEEEEDVRSLKIGENKEEGVDGCN